MPPFCETHQQYYERDETQLGTPLVCRGCEHQRYLLSLSNVPPPVAVTVESIFRRALAAAEHVQPRTATILALIDALTDALTEIRRRSGSASAAPAVESDVERGQG